MILDMAPRVAMNPQDPFNQLRAGYNRVGTNQPIARNIAFELDHQHQTRGIKLSGRVLPPLVQQFLVDYLAINDPAKLQRISRNTQFGYRQR